MFIQKLCNKHVIILTSLLFLYYIGRNSFLSNFSEEQQLTLGLLSFAIYIWVVKPIPTGVSSILLLASMLLLQLVSNVEEAVVGFLSPALYFILILSIISHSLVRVGIDKGIARFLIKISRGGPRTIIIGLPFIMLFLPIFLPSAVARFKMLHPLMKRLNHFYGFTEQSLFLKYCLYIIGMMNQNATMIIYTGGGFPILASQLLRDYNIANIGWLDWFLIIAPPLWIGLLLLAFFVWHYLKYTTPRDEWLTDAVPSNLVKEEKQPLTAKFWVVVGSFLAMILTWVITDQQYVPILLPPMLLVVFYSLPQIGLVTNGVIRKYDWENFLLLGASFSLGILIETNGTASVLAQELIRVIPEDAGILLKVMAIGLFIFLLRFLFIVPSSAIIVIFPVVISYSELIGIPPMQLAFLVVMITGSVMVLPIHSPTVFYAYETGVLKDREQYTIGMFSSLFIMVMAILAVMYYW